MGLGDVYKRQPQRTTYSRLSDSYRTVLSLQGRLIAADNADGMQVDELNESGTIKDSAEGDISAMRSGSIPAKLPDAAGTSTAPSARDAAGGAATQPQPAAATPGVDEAVVTQIQGISGASREQCIEALKASGGNADAATAMLLGL